MLNIRPTAFQRGKVVFVINRFIRNREEQYEALEEEHIRVGNCTDYPVNSEGRADPGRFIDLWRLECRCQSKRRIKLQLPIRGDNCRRERCLDRRILL